tara:strand:+ start:420 stop:623 length:204 start_codon:yes stop_codon:yes gene_type:complete
MGFCSIFGNPRDATPLYEIIRIFQKPAAYKAHNSSSTIPQKKIVLKEIISKENKVKKKKCSLCSEPI